MGQKVHPYGFRLGYNKTWKSRWFGGRNYQDLLHEDLKLKAYMKKRLYHAGISAIEIERAADKMTLNVFTAKPGIIIGRKGAEVDKLREDLQKMLKRKEVYINIEQVNAPEADAQLVAEHIGSLLERRIGFRRAMKKAMENAQKKGVDGIKIKIAGRLGGADIARTEEYAWGRIPLSTLKANIDYGFAESMTTYGVIGVKVWISKGEQLPDRSGRRSRR